MAAEENNMQSKINNDLVSGFLFNKSQSRVDMGIEIMNSYDFFEILANKYNILVPLMATNSWNKKENKLEINQNIFDPVSNTWGSKYQDYYSSEPSLQKGHETFKKIFKINKQSNEFLKLHIEHISPYVAKDFLDYIILEINNIVREDDLSDINKSILFLQNEINKTPFVEVKRSINNLIESQMERKMIANSTPEYLFKILSGPVVSQEKSFPKSIYFLFGGLLFGIISSCLFFVLRSLAKDDS